MGRLVLCWGRGEGERAHQQCTWTPVCTVTETRNRFLPSFTRSSPKSKTDLEWGGGSYVLLKIKNEKRRLGFACVCCCLITNRRKAAQTWGGDAKFSLLWGHFFSKCVISLACWLSLVSTALQWGPMSCHRLNLKVLWNPPKFKQVSSRHLVCSQGPKLGRGGRTGERGEALAGAQEPGSARQDGGGSDGCCFG